MSDAKIASGKKKKKRVERLLLVIALVISIAAVMTFSLLFQRINKMNFPDKMIYGTWVEQNVAPYAADQFILNKNGVVVDGGVVATQFSFDGKHFKYETGKQTRRFLFLNEELTEMRLVSEPNYQPIYRRIKSSP